MTGSRVLLKLAWTNDVYAVTMGAGSCPDVYSHYSAKLHLQYNLRTSVSVLKSHFYRLIQIL